MASSPFNWRAEPSTFAADPRFRATRGGIAVDQLAARTVRRRTAAEGHSPGVIYGISEAADKQLHLRKGTT